MQVLAILNFHPRNLGGGGSYGEESSKEEQAAPAVSVMSEEWEGFREHPRDIFKQFLYVGIGRHAAGTESAAQGLYLGKPGIHFFTRRIKFLQ